jgi:hypothetical protein
VTIKDGRNLWTFCDEQAIGSIRNLSRRIAAKMHGVAGQHKELAGLPDI